MGIKNGDFRVPRANGTARLINQSSTDYTPTVCAYAGEAEVMPLFKEMADEFFKIEQNGFVKLDGKKYQVHIRVGVTGDKAFMWKFTCRGGT